MNGFDFSVTSQTVFQRTERGQIEVLARRLPLSALERRLLQMLTGHTRLGDFQALLRDIHAPIQAVERLLESGLVCPVDVKVAPGEPFRPFEGAEQQGLLSGSRSYWSQPGHAA
ncbi:MAG TPA: hypothetical protein VFM48_12155 [Aquabacterium sp.]|nr:hypothetical protein [Aquabacterium sp.]